MFVSPYITKVPRIRSQIKAEFSNLSKNPICNFTATLPGVQVKWYKNARFVFKRLQNFCVLEKNCFLGPSILPVVRSHPDKRCA